MPGANKSRQRRHTKSAQPTDDDPTTPPLLVVAGSKQPLIATNGQRPAHPLLAAMLHGDRPVSPRLTELSCGRSVQSPQSHPSKQTSNRGRDCSALRGSVVLSSKHATLGLLPTSPADCFRFPLSSSLSALLIYLFGCAHCDEKNSAALVTYSLRHPHSLHRTGHRLQHIAYCNDTQTRKASDLSREEVEKVPKITHFHSLFAWENKSLGRERRKLEQHHPTGTRRHSTNSVILRAHKRHHAHCPRRPDKSP